VDGDGLQLRGGIHVAVCVFFPKDVFDGAHIPNEGMGNATSIVNLVRNIGGSFGIAMMTTFIARRTQVHHAHLAENITGYDEGTRQLMEGMRQWFLQHGADSYTATQRSLGAAHMILQRHAAMLSFVEAFWVMAAVFAGMILLVPLLRDPRKNRKRPPPRPARHAAHA
jgi:DHA2 family multidrug resistance protein